MKSATGVQKQVPDNLELSLKQVLSHRWRTFCQQQLGSWTRVIDSLACPETYLKFAPLQTEKGRKNVRRDLPGQQWALQ